MNHSAMHTVKSDFIVKHSLTISPRVRKTRKRRIENSSEICTTFVSLHPLFSSARFLFHFSCRRREKRLQMNWKGKQFIDFCLDAVLSQHFNPFVTKFSSNKPFSCIAWGRTRSTSLIFLLEVCRPVDDCSGGEYDNSRGGDESSFAMLGSWL